MEDSITACFISIVLLCLFSCGSHSDTKQHNEYFSLHRSTIGSVIVGVKTVVVERCHLGNYEHIFIFLTC